MANRSLFSPFASSVNPYGARAIGNLFGPRIKANPDYLKLLEPGVESSNEMLMSTRPYLGSGGLFGSGDRLADIANIQYLAPLIHAKFGADLATQKEKELIPFRSANELQYHKDLLTAKQQQEDAEREAQESRFGTSLGNVAANFPTEQMSNIIPQDATYSNPAEQARAYIAKFGTKTPVNEAVVQGDPRVIQANVGQELGKGLVKFGSGDLYNPLNNQVVEGPGTTEEVTTERVLTGKTEPYLDANGEVKYRPEVKEVPKIIRKPSPATQYKLPDVVTQPELDSYSKESGATPSNNSADLIDQTRKQLNLDLRQPPPPIKAQPAGPKESFLQSFVRGAKGFKDEIESKYGSTEPKGKKVTESENKPKERPVSYPFDYLIEANKLDKKQADIFENLIQGYRKNEKREPSLQEARTFIKIVVGNNRK